METDRFFVTRMRCRGATGTGFGAAGMAATNGHDPAPDQLR
jgi:hypothetical protein